MFGGGLGTVNRENLGFTLSETVLYASGSVGFTREERLSVV